MIFTKEERTKGQSHNYSYTVIGRLKDGVSYRQAPIAMPR